MWAKFRCFVSAEYSRGKQKNCEMNWQMGVFAKCQPEHASSTKQTIDIRPSLRCFKLWWSEFWTRWLTVRTIRLRQFSLRFIGLKWMVLVISIKKPFGCIAVFLIPLLDYRRRTRWWWIWNIWSSLKQACPCLPGSSHRTAILLKEFKRKFKLNWLHLGRSDSNDRCCHWKSASMNHSWQNGVNIF